MVATRISQRIFRAFKIRVYACHFAKCQNALAYPCCPVTSHQTWLFAKLACCQTWLLPDSIVAEFLFCQTSYLLSLLFFNSDISRPGLELNGSGDFSKLTQFRFLFSPLAFQICEITMKPCWKLFLPSSWIS